MGKKNFFVFVFVLLLVVPAVSAIDTNTAGPLPTWYSTYITNGTSPNLIGDYSNNPNQANFTPANGSVVRISRLLIVIADQNIDNADEYGGGAALTRGITFSFKENGSTRRIDSGLNTTKNWEFHRLGYDVAEDSSKASGEDVIAVRWSFDKAGTDLRLNGTRGDAIIVSLADNIDLDGHYFKLQGYNETQYTIGIGPKDPKEVNKMSWQTGTILMFIAGMALYAFIGMYIKDKKILEIETDKGILKKEMINGLVSSLKTLYILVIPAFLLLGIHIVREMAIAGGASLSVTDSLFTAWQIFLGIYIITLLVFLIMVIKMVLNYLFKPVQELSQLSNRKMRR